MPLYDFRCHTCGRDFTELVAWSKRSQVRCPHCGGEAQEQVSAFAVGSTGGQGSRTSGRPRFT